MTPPWSPSSFCIGYWIADTANVVVAVLVSTVSRQTFVCEIREQDGAALFVVRPSDEETEFTARDPTKAWEMALEEGIMLPFMLDII